MMEFLARPFGVMMEFIYYNLAFENYVFSLVIYALFTRLILLPLTIKQQKTMERQQELMPEITALKEKYGNDQKRFQEEQMNLYTKYKINPSSGCLTLLIQFPLLMALYEIVRKPLTYISGLSATSVQKVVEFLNTTTGSNTYAASNEIPIINYFTNNPSKLNEVSEWMGEADIIDFKLFGFIDLSMNPPFPWNFGQIFGNPGLYLPLLLIPIFVILSQYLSQYISMHFMRKDTGKKETNNSMNGMMKIMPLMTLVFSFMFPASMGVYWIIGNIITIGQTVITKTVLSGKKKEED